MVGDSRKGEERPPARGAATSDPKKATLRSLSFAGYRQRRQKLEATAAADPDFLLFLEFTGPANRFRPERLIRNKHPTVPQPAWMLVNKLIRIKREPKNSLFP
jgi:hypothetical protein